MCEFLKSAKSLLYSPHIQSALKTPILGAKDGGGSGSLGGATGAEERNFDTEDGLEQWKTVCRIPLPLAFVSRYLWATDKLRFGEIKFV
jgi:hypothetical protein